MLLFLLASLFLFEQVCALALPCFTLDQLKMVSLMLFQKKPLLFVLVSSVQDPLKARNRFAPEQIC